MTSIEQLQTAKRVVQTYHGELVAASAKDTTEVIRRYTSGGYEWHGPHPFNTLPGADALADGFWLPLKHACPDLERRDDVFMAGSFEDGTWVGSTGHLLGNFTQALLNIPPTPHPVFLRYGEFHRVADERVVETYVIYDLIGLMLQAGLQVMPASLGSEILIPGPATHDGLLMEPQDATESARSLEITESMIFDGLRAYDESDIPADVLGRWWHKDMMWYGPAGIGTTRGIDGFKHRHQIPMREGLSARDAGYHKTRFGEGLYSCSVGWPSYYAAHTGGGWMGLPVTDKKIGMRVMDFWRRDGDLLRENWVFVDLVDTFLQLGYDLMQRVDELVTGQR